MDPAKFRALRSGVVDGYPYPLSVVDLGMLNLPSGRLEASDPFVNLGEGFVVNIAPGQYPVRVTLADVSEERDGSHIREAYLSVIVAEGMVARVEHAIAEGMEHIPDATSYGVPVDAGTVAFADNAAVQRCMPGTDNEEFEDWYDDIFDNGTDSSWFSLMDSPAHLREGCANITMPLATNGENVVLSHSGWGDGIYSVLKTFDADGNLLGVHIDLLLTGEDEFDYESAAPTSQAPGRGSPKGGFFSRLFGRGPVT